MNRFIALTKILLKTSGAWLSKPTKNKSRGKSIGLKLLIAIGFTPLVLMIVEFISVLYDALSPIGQEGGVILGLGFSLSNMIIFMFGIFFIMGIFYFAMDINNLLPLPFKASQILGAKFIVVLAYEYLTELVVLLPIIVVFGFKSGAGLLYYLYGLMIFLMLPIFPLVLGSLIVMIIMRFTSLTKNKDKFIVVAGIVAMVFGIGLNILIQKVTGSSASPEEIQQMILGGNNSLVELTSNFFPTSKAAAYALIDSNSLNGLTNIIHFLAITIISIVIFLVLGEKLYFKGVIGISETTSKRKKLSSSEFSKATVKNSVLRSYTLKELKVLFRTPTYLMNCVISNFIWPVFMLIFIFISGDGTEDLRSLGKYINDPDVLGIVLASGFGIIMFMSVSNAITSTSISREGQNLFVKKYLPIGYDKQIMAKVLSGFIMSIVGMIVLLIVVSILFKPSVLIIALIALTGLLGILFSSFVGMIIDLNRPKLDWENEQKAVKQNFNVFFAMVPCLIAAAITIGIVIGLRPSLWVTALSILVIYSIADVILYKTLMTKGVKLFSNLEV